MPKIKPFSGLRFDEVLAGSLGRVVAPPYDVISKQEEGQLRARSGYNIVHVDLPDGAHAKRRYSEAGRRYRLWRRDGILVQDPLSLYVLEQSYTRAGKQERVVGLLAAVHLEPLGGAILPHEQTLTGPKADRLALMRATDANISPIYGIYAEPTLAAQGTMRAITSREPVAETDDGCGVSYRLWRTDDPGEIGRLVAILDGTRMVIADGHHRYETALAYRDERRKQALAEGHSPGGEDPYDYTLMFLVNVDDTDFDILPVHRVIRLPARRDLKTLLSALDDRFNVATLAGGDVEQLLVRMAEEVHTPTFGMYAGAKDLFYVLRLKSGVDVEHEVPDSHSSAWKHLDVSLLHGLVIESALGIDPEDVREQRDMAFVKDPNEAVHLVDAKEFDLAFFLNPIPVQSLLRIATGGETMPQKSTYFYPKPLTGLVINPLD